MNNHTPGAWKYLKNDDGTFSIFPVESENFEAELLAEAFTEDNARLIASAPELYQALICAAETIRATEVFMCAQGLIGDEIGKIINTIDDLLERIDGGDSQ